MINNLRNNPLHHKTVSLAHLKVDDNMLFDFDQVKRDEIPADVLMKFKWRVIQKLMETKGPQV